MKKFRETCFLPDDAVFDEMDSPVGVLTLVASPKGLHAVLWDIERDDVQYREITQRFPQKSDDNIIVVTKKQLTEYFLGKRKQFDLPLVMNGTDFQMQAWKQLLKIPYANTISYGEQAEKMGDKKKARAVGAANGCNPISIIVPCHRVIGSTGKLVGFGGGVDKKAFLLQMEAAVC